MIGALPQTPEFIAFVFPKMGRKNRRQKSAAHFGVKSVQPLRSHSCVAVSCRTEKANYIINNCLEDYSIYTVCATLPTCVNRSAENPYFMRFLAFLIVVLAFSTCYIIMHNMRQNRQFLVLPQKFQ